MLVNLERSRRPRSSAELPDRVMVPQGAPKRLLNAYEAAAGPTRVDRQGFGDRLHAQVDIITVLVRWVRA